MTHSNWFKAWTVFVVCVALATLVFTYREWRACNARDGIFIATQTTWPICLDKDVLR